MDIKKRSSGVLRNNSERTYGNGIKQFSDILEHAAKIYRVIYLEILLSWLMWKDWNYKLFNMNDVEGNMQYIVCDIE